jgi:hypothetical protein
MAMKFKYTVKAHPTMYNGVQYRSRLEARWAAFFDLIGWKHEYEPIDLPGWSPDFRVVFPCGHSECSGSHTLLVEVKPYFRLEQFKGHPSCDYIGCGLGHKWTPDLCCSAAQFGANPEVTFWSMGHGSGGGDFCLIDWENFHSFGYSRLWAEAGNSVQWHPKDSQRPTGKLSAIIWDAEQAQKRNRR